MTEAQLHETASKQNIEARLWQDPFAAIAKYVRKTRDAESEGLGKCTENSFKKELSGNAEVFGVMLPGGPYAELSEVRRRTRFAVLSGLERQRYTGETQDHIGCWTPKLSKSHFSPMRFRSSGFNKKAARIGFLFYGSTKTTLIGRLCKVFQAFSTN
jgi:hypothetical protein